LRLWFRRGGVENDAIGGAFGNLAHVVFDSDARRGANALDQEFSRTQNRELSDCRQARTRANYCRGDMQGKGLGNRRGENGSAGRGMATGRSFSRVKVALLEPGSNRRAAPARIWKLPAGSVQLVAGENGGTCGNISRAEMSAVGLDDCAEERRGSAREKRLRQRTRQNCGEDYAPAHHFQ